MTEVKICGIKNAEAMNVAVEAGADFVGFVFFPPSPRAIAIDAAAALAPHARDVPIVGLFVEPTIAAIEAVLASVPLHALQIYGADTMLPTIRARFKLPIWHARGLKTEADLPQTFSDGADRLVLEAKPPAGANRPGGNATTFDWSILRGWTAPQPWILAGGLTPDNVADAIRQTGASAVDVSSGVERDKGVKDPDLIRAFIAAAKVLI
jgi:phosphoribosylanthranilate isomerase